MTRTRLAVWPLAVVLAIAATLFAADAPPVIPDRWSTPPEKPQPLLTHHTFKSPST